jgi:tetratricopeptide (TPR) repeat protein
MKLSKLTTLVFVLGAILYSSKVDAQNVPNVLDSGRESRLLLVQVNLQDAESYFQRSGVRFQSGDLKGAIEDLNQALRLNPNWEI